MKNKNGLFDTYLLLYTSAHVSSNIYFYKNIHWKLEKWWSVYIILENKMVSKVCQKTFTTF